MAKQDQKNIRFRERKKQLIVDALASKVDLMFSSSFSVTSNASAKSASSEMPNPGISLSR